MVEGEREEKRNPTFPLFSLMFFFYLFTFRFNDKYLDDIEYGVSDATTDITISIRTMTAVMGSVEAEGSG